MATTISDEDVQCYVCKKKYNDGKRLPKRLNCSHSLCATCLKVLVAVNQSFKCPHCSKENLQVNSVDDLATDFATIRLIQIMDSSTSCQSCARICDVQTCGTCARKLCEKCAWVCYYVHLQEFEAAKQETPEHETATPTHVQAKSPDLNAEDSLPVVLRKPTRCSLAVGLLAEFIDTEANFDAAIENDQKETGKRKRKIRKEDIGVPTNFRHIYHIGYNPDKGYDLAEVDPDMKMLLDAIGVSQSELYDVGTSEFIHHFIEENGGMEAVRAEAERLRGSEAPKKPERGQIMDDYVE